MGTSKVDFILFPDLDTSFLLHKKKLTILAGCVHFVKAVKDAWEHKSSIPIEELHGHGT